MYDVIIIGGGPAGISAGIYAVRSGLETLIVEGKEINGQIALTETVENYPGFSSISGIDLMEKFNTHAKDAGVAIEKAQVLSIRVEDGKKIIRTANGELETKCVIMATGANPKHLGVPGEEDFRGKGVSYCVTCDGFFFRDKEVIVVGGGDSAITDALSLSNFVKKVYVVHRRDSLRAEKVLQDRAFAKDNIEFIWNTVLEEIIGEGVVKKVSLKNVKSSDTKEMDIAGVFIYIGITPNTDFVDVDKDFLGFISTNGRMETSVEGIYAAGDCRHGSLRQVVTAVNDGAIAAICASEYIDSLSE